MFVPSCCNFQKGVGVDVQRRTAIVLSASPKARKSRALSSLAVIANRNLINALGGATSKMNKGYAGRIIHSTAPDSLSFTILFVKTEEGFWQGFQSFIS
jgi:hypothetical protein